MTALLPHIKKRFQQVSVRTNVNILTDHRITPLGLFVRAGARFFRSIPAKATVTATSGVISVSDFFLDQYQEALSCAHACLAPSTAALRVSSSRWSSFPCTTRS